MQDSDDHVEVEDKEDSESDQDGKQRSQPFLKQRWHECILPHTQHGTATMRM